MLEGQLQTADVYNSVSRDTLLAEKPTVWLIGVGDSVVLLHY